MGVRVPSGVLINTNLTSRLFLIVLNILFLLMKGFLNKFIGHSALFIIFYYESYVAIDWTQITKLGRIYYAVFAWIRAILLWLICPIALPEYFWKRSKMYQDFLVMQARLEKQIR